VADVVVYCGRYGTDPLTDRTIVKRKKNIGMDGYNSLLVLITTSLTFHLWHEPSVCRLFVTLLRPTHTVELFGNILLCLIAYGLGQFELKF